MLVPYCVVHASVIDCDVMLCTAHLLPSGCLSVWAVPTAGDPLLLLADTLPLTEAPSSLNLPAPSPVKDGACMTGDPRRGSWWASQPTLLAATQFSPAVDFRTPRFRPQDIDNPAEAKRMHQQMHSMQEHVVSLRGGFELAAGVMCLN